MKDIRFIIEPYMELLVGSVVEIGSERGGGSTEFLSALCLEHALKFYSVDFEEGAYKRAKRIPSVNAFQMTGELFLANFDGEICLAYLDNFDFVWPTIEERPKVLEQKEIYRTYGFEMTNINSKRAHLLQCIEIERLAADKCIVILDDTWSVEYRFDGKGGMAVPYLLVQGFNLFHVTAGLHPHQRFVMVERGLR